MTEAAVLAANEAFYRAFAAADGEAMVALWAAEAPVSCIHPGAPTLAGRAIVLESWRAILANQGPSDMHCVEARATVMGYAALVTCYEVLGGHLLAATNVFVREGGNWRMVHHQAGPTAARLRTPPPAAATPRSVH